MRGRLHGLGRAWRVVPAALALLFAAQATAQGGGLAFRVQPITDPQLGHLTIGTIAVPEQWRVKQSVQWRLQDVSQPLHVYARAESPDGSMWVEFFPLEVFYWL